MKNQYKLFLTGALILTLAFSACKKYLDAKPDDKLVIPSNVADLQALLDNTDNITGTYGPESDEASADNYYLSLSTYQSFPDLARKIYTWDEYIETYPNSWSRIYDVVYYSNLVLENIAKISPTPQNRSDWENVKGTALFLRALSYLRCAFIFSKAYDENSYNDDYGIVLRQTSDFNLPSKRANVKDTYTKIISDLEMAVTLLPITPKHVMRPSKPAAYALLSRVYLSMRKYDKAFSYADLSLQLKSDLIDYNSLSDISGLTPFEPYIKEIIYANSIEQYTLGNTLPFVALVDTTLLTSYSSNDLRKDAFFSDALIFGQTGQLFKGTYSGTLTGSFIGIAVDEVYLTRAECSARLGNKESALADLNKLMKNRWKAGLFQPFTASTTDEALKLILKERRKELLFRGLRWMDIKRLNKEGEGITLTRVIDGHTYTLPPNDNRYALPLPSDIINITGLPQNPR